MHLSASEVMEALTVTRLLFSFEEGKDDSLRRISALEQRTTTIAFIEKKAASDHQFFFSFFLQINVFHALWVPNESIVCSLSFVQTVFNLNWPNGPMKFELPSFYYIKPPLTYQYN